VSEDEVIRADAVKPLEVRWLWNGHIPEGMLTLIAGRPGEGKSLFAAYLAATISKTGAVIFSNMEDPLAHVVRPRLEAAKAKLSNVVFVNFRLPRDLDKLEALIEEYQPKLVVVDPVAAHLSVSIYNDQDVRTVLTPLTKLAADNGLAFVGIHHTVKNTSPQAHPLRAIGGSGGGLAGAARAVYVFGVSPQDIDERVLAPVKFNLGPMPRSCVFEMDDHEFVIGAGYEAQLIHAGRLLLLNEKSKVTATQILMHGSGAGFRGTKSQPKLEQAAGFLSLYLALGPRPVEELHEDALQNGLGWRTVRRAAEEVGVQIVRRGGGPGSYSEWALPSGHPALVVKQCRVCLHDEGDHNVACTKPMCSCTGFEEQE
jgi:hypothetical protein